MVHALNDLMEPGVPVGTEVAGILSVSPKKSGDPLDVGTSSSNCKEVEDAAVAPTKWLTGHGRSKTMSKHSAD